MKIILKYILNNVKERKTRTVVMLLSVILSTTLLFVSLSITESYESAQRKMAKGIAGKATIAVSLQPSANGDMSWIKEEAVPSISTIKNKVGIIKTPGFYNEDRHFENFDILAADLNKLSKINKPRLLDGGELNDFTGYKIVLPEKFTSKYHVHIGDSIRLKIGGKPIEFRLAAIAAYDTVFLRSTRGVNALIPKQTMEEILDIENEYSEILIEPKEGVNTDVLKSELTRSITHGGYRIQSVVNEKQVEGDARQKSMPFFLISFFVLTMSIFIIYSSYKVIIIERLPAIGTFRSIGANEKNIINILMLESLLYGIFGGILGIPLGLAVLKLILQGLGQSLSQGIEIPIVVSPINIVISCIVAIVVSLLSAYIPVRHASKLPVKDIVLGSVEEENISNTTKFTFGVVLLAASIVLPRIASGKVLIIAGGFSLISLIAAAIIVIPLITSMFSSLFEGVYGSIFGNEGKLAARNIKCNKNTNQNITLLFISISAVIAISVVSSFVKTYIGDVFKGSEMSGFVDANMDEEFVQKIKNVDSIKTVLPVYVLNDSILSKGNSLGRVEAAEDLSMYNAMFAVKYDNENVKKEIERNFVSGRNILLENNLMHQQGVKVGDTISITDGRDAYEYRVIGTYKSRASSSQAIIPSACAVKDFGSKKYGLLTFQADDPDAAMSTIRDLFGNETNWSRTVKEFNEEALGVVDAFLKPLQKLTYFIVLLATMGIINNLLVNYIQKRRFIAMYKSVGLSNKQNIKMTLIEGFSSGLIGAVLGIAVSYLEIKTIFLVAGPRISMEPELQISAFVMAGLIGIIISLIGSIVPIMKGSNMKIVEEIKFE